MGIPQEKERETGKNPQVAGSFVVVGDLLCCRLLFSSLCQKGIKLDFETPDLLDRAILFYHFMQS